MKKTLIALAIFTLSGVAFAENASTSTCNGTGACSPVTSANTATVGDNRNGQVAVGGAIANGANVQAYGGTTTSTNTNRNVNTTGASTATVGNTSATGGSVGNTSATGGASTSSSTTGASTSSSTSGGNTMTGGAVNVNMADNSATVEAARAHADALRYAADHQLRNTPSVANAALTSSNDTCMGSVSVGGSGPGFGIAVGSTYKDDNCVMLKNSRELWNMGFKAAAMALMCTDSANKDALELTGFVCPQTARAQRGAVQAAPSEQHTDPIVRKRLGLPPLK